MLPRPLASSVHILAEDPHAVDPDALKEIGIVRTMIGGRTVFEA